MYEDQSQTTPAEARKDDGLSCEAYQAARERFFARLLADLERRRLEGALENAHHAGRCEAAEVATRVRRRTDSEHPA